MTAAYFNVHGEPLTLSAKDAVVAREPMAYSRCDEFGWKILRGTKKRGPHWSNPLLGAGFNEEAAWRDALSRMRIEDNAAEARA